MAVMGELLGKVRLQLFAQLVCQVEDINIVGVKVERFRPVSLQMFETVTSLKSRVCSRVMKAFSMAATDSRRRLLFAVFMVNLTGILYSNR